VFKTTPEKQLASWLFIRWFTQPENTARWAMVANYFPVRQSSIDLPEMTEYLAANPVYEKAFELLVYGKAEPAVAAWSQIRGVINNATVAVINGADPKTTLDAAVQEANQLLAAD
jgi:multiple sugar transport system substrate-binding protein